jgi:hypothetical protein
LSFVGSFEFVLVFKFGYLIGFWHSNVSLFLYQFVLCFMLYMMLILSMMIETEPKKKLTLRDLLIGA